MAKLPNREGPSYATASNQCAQGMGEDLPTEFQEENLQQYWTVIARGMYFEHKTVQN